ncbi:hypothetical protein [Candidatus Phaeomarinobacter ectocarpi]|uniref:hypothetical protein n=1 Tax=Candidatus Phaeomarinibacter ectocarpi TaxID=1458461 RepID=UPI001A7E6B27|nr:hypothetical protein [Candidatus Phaeomarinobacter ectocarpi]
MSSLQTCFSQHFYVDYALTQLTAFGMALTKQAILGSWRGAVTGVAMGAAALLSPLSATDAHAVDVNKLTDEQLQEVCARDTNTETINIQAGQHSLCTRDISIIVFGNADNATGAQIGAFLEKQFAERGIPTKVF